MVISVEAFKTLPSLCYGLFRDIKHVGENILFIEDVNKVSLSFKLAPTITGLKLEQLF